MIKDWILWIEIFWQALNLVNLILCNVKDKNCGILFVDKHLAKVTIEQELLVLEMLLFLLFFFLFLLLGASCLLLFFFRLFFLKLPRTLVRRRLWLLSDEADARFIAGP